MNKFLVLGASLLAILSFMGAGIALAGTGSAGAGDFPPVVERLADRFNLNRSQVQEEMESFRTQRQQERHKAMEGRLEEHLDEAVENGKITEAQKQDILKKHEQIQQRMQEIRSLSWEERREEKDEIRDEMHAWLEDQGIEPGLFGPLGGRGSGPKGHFEAGYHHGPGLEGCRMTE